MKQDLNLMERLRDWQDYEPAKMFGGEILKDIAEAADEIARLRAALREISCHWTNQYDHPRKENEMYRGSYGIGITDGHRACKIIADKALTGRDDTRD